MKKTFVAASALLMTIEAVVMQVPVLAAPRLIVQSSSNYQKPLPPVNETQTKTPIPAMTFGLSDGTPVKLKFKQTVSSKINQTNDTIEFEVAEDVMVGDAIVIAKGAFAKGTVVMARRSGMLGRRGKLKITVEQVTLVSGERVSLRANQRGGGGTAGGVIALAAVINPLFLFMKGKNVTYEAGTPFLAFVDGNFALDPAKFRVVSQK